ncbi:MAG TPA: cytochrome c-type biogenesis protein [Asticcacaulis sp.]|nr:cytochrome c-type biogenesis protein [Asticcacaulis sp.]
MKYLILLLLLLPSIACADPAQDEARAQKLFSEVRCVQCQSESIQDSDAAIAADMRREVRADIAKGMSDAQIRTSLYDHYGDYVLFRPRLTKSNLILWALPPLIALIGAGLLFARRKTPENSITSSLSAEERKKLQELLKKHD